MISSGRASHFTGILAGLTTFLCAVHAIAYSPGTGSPSAVDGFTVNRADRKDVLVFYNVAYNASQNFETNMAWTGNVATGVAGTTSATYKEDVRRRVNFFRAMVGLPADITFDSTKSGKCQKAALMFSANNDLDHFPPNTWTWWTADGYEAANNSSIALGNHGPDAINAYMEDYGTGNEIVGHRRWMLYSRAQQMGTGDIPYNPGNHESSNALWVIGNFKPAPTPQFVAWPNAGYSPRSLMPERWSLSYPGANFASATVTMTVGGSSVGTTIISNNANGYGDNTLVWVPAGLPATVTNDVICAVTVSGISGAGIPASHSYNVILFNPDVLGESITITGTNTPPTTGQGYTFNSITQADQYELKVAQSSAATWTEGAEDSPTPKITDQTTGYTLRQTGLKNTGAKAFQLAFPDFVDQSFIVTRDIIPGASSQLQWYDRGRFATTTTTMHAEVSTDNGTTWTSVFSRNGVGLSSVNWDASWISRGINLSAYAGQVIRVRFILRQNGGSITTGTSSSYGFFIDDITITNATELVNSTTTSLASNATSFTLNSSTAGSALVAGTQYHMQLRPSVGLRWYGFGPLKSVTAQTPTGYAGWIATNYPAVTGGINADHENDGIRNGLEYAFNLNPTSVNTPSQVPQPVVSGGNLTLSFTQPAGITGVTYGAEWSEDLAGWTPLTDTGSGNTHVFTKAIGSSPRLFIRHKIVIAE